MSCESAADCGPGHACTVHERLDLVCAMITPNDFGIRDVQNDDRYLHRLLLLRRARFSASPATCTAKACVVAGGRPARCCNRCRDTLAFSGFEGVTLTNASGEELRCDDRMDCEPPSCSVPLDVPLEVTGTFRRRADQLIFELARPPKAVRSK